MGNFAIPRQLERGETTLESTGSFSIRSTRTNASARGFSAAAPSAFSVMGWGICPLDLEAPDSQNLTTLAGRFDVSKYLTGFSGIVALMTLEHQVGVINRLNATTFQYNRLRRDGLTDSE